uniref:Calcium channel, voltage-dependent, alpha 2/delta subunit 1a n=1 Tax=Lates calcarifer TaxID=8187 RepID=A0A4W6C8I4_LATCA
MNTYLSVALSSFFLFPFLSSFSSEEYVNQYLTPEDVALSLFFCVLRIKEWVDQMQKELITLTDTASGLQDLIQVTHFSVESNNARELVATAAGNIERLLANRSKALEVSVISQNYFVATLIFLENHEPEKKNRYVPDDFHIDADFKRLVSYNTTAVHIPTDIYERSTIILNELNWTEALEEVFRKNKEEDPSLLWQVFGSATGLARYYPASPWIDLSNSANKIDLYDVRRRPWYIQGAASPKDMLILVDASGSVSGLTLKLIRTSVSTMLDTLSDDDYVNVVYFNEKALSAACFQNLVQANVRNKRILKDAVQNIIAKGVTRYQDGFKLAFKQLAQNCKHIMSTEKNTGVFAFNHIQFLHFYLLSQVRIFTFSVGQHNYDKGPIQWMACTNKGYYYEIPSIGAIRINTQEYLDVLGRPMWTNVYLDALELGLVITGTLPVFNKTSTGSKKSQNQLILGVMAIDVSLEDIKRLTPRFTFGPNGYYFAIDPNGYVLLHPNLQPLQDCVHADAVSDDEIFLSVCVPSLSLALVLPEYSMHYIRATIGDTITQAKFSESLLADKFDEYGYTFIAPRVYCKDLKPPNKNKNNTEFLMEFNNYIDTKTPNNPMCNVELVNRLLLDAGITSDLIKLWKQNELQLSRAAGFYWKEEAETYESSFYKRSLDNDLYIFTPTPYPNKENTTDDSILVSRAVNLNIDGINLKPADDGFRQPNCSALLCFQCNGEMCGCQRNDAYVDCIILDDGGFLVMSNQDKYIDQIGSFFGVIDPTLMRKLNDSLFTLKQTYDYQSLCDPKKESKAAAGPRSVYVPTIADILNLGWWATAAACPVQIYIYTVCIFFKSFFMFVMCPFTAEMDDEVSDAMLKEVCITKQTQYYFMNNNLSFRGTIDCENCSRLYHAEKLPKTNLVFIITDAKLTCLPCDATLLKQEEEQSEGPDPCELAKKPRYRKGPSECFDNNEHEDDADCGGASSLSPSLWLMVALQLVLLWVLTGSRNYAVSS